MVNAAELPRTTRDDIMWHAHEGFEQGLVEVCGLIVKRGVHQRAVRCHNSAMKPQKGFRIAASEWQRVEDEEGEVIAAYHSHVNEPPMASPGDRTEAEKHQLPFVIIGVPQDAWDVYVPQGWRAPLYGRPFVHGILDCYTWIQDYYRQECGIVLPDFEREDDWWLHGQNLYIENFAKAGFTECPKLQLHDALIIQWPHSPVPNHCAAYLGDGMIGHHPADRISTRNPYREGHGLRVHKIVRHAALW